jgi:hypothetical protein
MFSTFIPLSSFFPRFAWIALEPALAAADAPLKAADSPGPTPGMNLETVLRTPAAAEATFSPNLAILAPVVLTNVPTFLTAFWTPCLIAVPAFWKPCLIAAPALWNAALIF